MSDMLCRKCGEPSDVYYVYHELSDVERVRFLRGEGCDCCGFGEKCPSCNGKGTRIEFRYVAQFGEWRHVHTDEPCARCAGTGVPRLDDEAYTEALYSLLESDEDVSIYV